MKLGFILEPAAPNSHYRVLFPMYALARRGHTVLWPSTLERGMPMKQLLGCDLVHCFRRLDAASDLRQLSSRGVAISFDNDDYLPAADVASTHAGGLEFGARAQFQNLQKFTQMLKVARFADLTTTPSRVLAERFRSAGAEHVAVIENFLDTRMPGFGLSAKHDGIVVGWAAGKDHEKDLPNLPIVAALERLLAKHDDLRVMTVGSRLPLTSPRYEYRKAVPFDELLRAMATIDIGIAPLADTEFNRSRSNVKLKEYGAVGATWLASPVGAYREMGTREGGHLVDGDWFDAIDDLVRHRFKRRRLSRQALRWARSQTADDHASLWEDAFQGAIERAAARRREPQRRAAVGGR